MAFSKNLLVNVRWVLLLVGSCRPLSQICDDEVLRNQIMVKATCIVHISDVSSIIPEMSPKIKASERTKKLPLVFKVLNNMLSEEGHQLAIAIKINNTKKTSHIKTEVEADILSRITLGFREYVSFVLKYCVKNFLSNFN